MSSKNRRKRDVRVKVARVSMKLNQCTGTNPRSVQYFMMKDELFKLVAKDIGASHKGEDFGKME